MPVETVLNHLQLHSKKNQLVYENITRLWDVHDQAESIQDILDGLHPWAGPISLKFENSVSYVLTLFGLVLCCSIFISAGNIVFQTSFVIGLALLFLAWLNYEQDNALHEVIQALEHKVIGFKYGLQFHATPVHLHQHLRGGSLAIKLKQLFPLFNLGSIANDFPLYASTLWQDENDAQHSVLIFQYRYVTEINIRDKHGDKVRVKEIEQFLYGLFIFETSLFHGIALSTQQRQFAAPYDSHWKTSDIVLNQKLKIFGTSANVLARQLSPSNVLKFDQFFQHQDGSLLFHPSQQCLCFLAKKNLFQRSAKKQEIYDIPTLRGYLRTFKLPYLEQLKSDIITLLKSNK